MKNLDILIDKIIQFRDDRDWKQFHNSKDLALAISIEASELNELFLWRKNEDVDVDKLKEELADVLIYTILLAHKHQLNILSIISDKIAKNATKYPIDSTKGTARKYNEL